MTDLVKNASSQTRQFHIKVLGRMLELLGVQMYKRRDAAIAELVANCWDADAKNVWIIIPDDATYNPHRSMLVVEDDGSGMDENDMEHKYLVIGRNRRVDENSEEVNGRKIMGRKGIGKLAGFGIASVMRIETWKNQRSIDLSLNIDLLKNNPLTEQKEDIEKTIQGTVRNEVPSGIRSLRGSGTRLTLTKLKQSSPMSEDSLHQSLARRFSRTVQGHMTIHINGTPLRPIQIELHEQSPLINADMSLVTLSDGNQISYNYSFSKTPIRNDELKGWTILVKGKTAQAPPFYFGVDSVGAFQHSSKYMFGTIEADFLDAGKEDESDIISTDRQEIDWERPEVKSLFEWGKKFTQEIFEQIGQRNSEATVNVVLENIEFKSRIDAIDPASKSLCLKFIGSIGSIKVEGEEMSKKDKIFQLADQIIKAFEYRHFVDVIDDIQQASEDPENLNTLLTHLEKWEILESRSILEIIKGRIKVIDKFYDMIVNRASETANRDFGADNFHDLIAGFPWLLNPEWQVYLEEKSISTILKQKGETDFPELMKNKRVDFLALEGDDTIAIIEIKSVDDVLPLDELRKLEDYKIALTPAHKKDIRCVLIFGGSHNIEKSTWDAFKKRPDFLILEWKDVFVKNKEYYEHYRAVLENHISNPNFKLKIEEIKNTKKMLEKNSVHRGEADRKEGLGPQDLNKPID